MTKARSPTQYKGVRAIKPPNVVFADRAPTSTDKAYVKGDLWLDETGLASYQFAKSSWIALGTGATGGVVTITASSGGPLSPSAGNININGTANQVTTAGSGSTVTLTTPATFIAPGSIASTTTLTSGSTLTVTTSATVGTTLGVTGNITTTGGNVAISGAAKQLQVHGGAVTDFIGAATLVLGTVTVANTNIAATDRIIPFRIDANASTTLGGLSYTISAAASFTITSLQIGTPGSTETGDLSTVGYLIVRQL